MRKLFDYNIFGNDRPILKFFILLLSVLGASLLGRFLFCLTEGGKMDWDEYILFSITLILLSSISYFTGRLIAYKTKLFPRIQNRDHLLIGCFLGLYIILGVILVII